MRVSAAHVTLAGVVVLWAGSFAAIKALLDGGVDDVDIALVRYAVAAPGFAYILWRSRGLPGLTRADAARVAVAGLVVVVLYHLTLNLGEQWTTSGTAALIVATAPAMTLGFAAALGLERVTGARLAGLALAFTGVAVVVVLGAGERIGADTVKGPVLILGAPIGFATYNVIAKPLLARYGTLEVTAATSLVGTAALLALVRPATVDAVAGFDAGEWALIAYLGIGCTLVGYLAWSVGLRRLDPSQAVTFLYGVPVLGLAIGAVLLDEPITAWLLAGAALVVGGIALAQRPAGAPAPEPASEPAGSGGMAADLRRAPRG
jgi:drug/metabolite transporter (DMT)-like permease